MKDYSLLDESLLSAVRSLPHYQSWIKSLNRYGFLGLAERHYNSFTKEFNSDYLQFVHLVDKFGLEAVEYAVKAVHNAYMRTTRVRKRIRYIFDAFNQCAFITFTFSDDYIQYSFDSLLSYVKSTLRKISSCWVVNDDYGDKNNRLHFHACCSADLCDISSLSDLWKYGFVNVRFVNVADDDQRRVSRYMTKLARHATKFGTGKAWFSRLNK